MNKKFLPQVVDFLVAASLTDPTLTFDNESLRETFENHVEASPFARAWESASGMSHLREFEQIVCLMKEQKSYPMITSLKNLTLGSERERMVKELQDWEPCHYCGETTHKAKSCWKKRDFARDGFYCKEHKKNSSHWTSGCQMLNKRKCDHSSREPPAPKSP